MRRVELDCQLICILLAPRAFISRRVIKPGSGQASLGVVVVGKNKPKGALEKISARNILSNP